MANQIASVVLSDVLRDELWHHAYREYVQLTWDRAGEKIQKMYEHHLSKGGA
jgi:glycosyltransferase involved in cell wall biosynthesis